MAIADADMRSANADNGADDDDDDMNGPLPVDDRGVVVSHVFLPLTCRAFPFFFMTRVFTRSQRGDTRRQPWN